MPPYRYLKSTPRITYPVEAVSLLSFHKNKILVASSYALIVTGIFLIGNALLPILSYQLVTSTSLSRFSSPKVLTYTKSQPQSVLATEPVDLTNPTNWFAPAASNPPPPAPLPRSNIEFYNLSIPKLGIKNAVVSVGGTDLGKSLIQYSGTSQPGQLGNPVIFGHSVLPQFFNPKNYISIFSTLPSLKPGDQILVDYDGIQYKYEVSELKEVKPSEISVLEQRYDRREISIITCVPPGTYLRRLVIKANLVQNRI